LNGKNAGSRLRNGTVCSTAPAQSATILTFVAIIFHRDIGLYLRLADGFHVRGPDRAA
jgi:hypothetical protein